MTPLMDVMFLLLTFFIFAFAVMVRLKVTDVRLPPAGKGADAPRGQTITLTLRATGEIRVQDRTLPLDEVSAEIHRLRAAQGEGALLIAVDEAAPAGDLMLLVDALRDGGFTDLRFLRALTPRPAEPQPTATPPKADE